jgi:hypothetical protein
MKPTNRSLARTYKLEHTLIQRQLQSADHHETTSRPVQLYLSEE